MAKITTQARELFSEKSQVHKDEISKILANEKQVLASIEKDKEEIESRYVINAAGVYADEIHNMIRRQNEPSVNDYAENTVRTYFIILSQNK